MAKTKYICVCGPKVNSSEEKCVRCTKPIALFCACGNPKTQYAKKCKECHLKATVSSVKTCKCGKRLYTTKGDTCRTCLEGVYIPIDVLQPLLVRLVAERHYIERDGTPTGGFTQLWREIDDPQDPDNRFHEKRLHDLVHKRQKVVSYNVVDRILARTHNFHLWYEEPFCHWFHEPDTEKRRWSERKCLECGESVQRGSVRCRDCYEKLRASKIKYCECGTRLKHGSKRCWECHVRQRGKGNAGGRKYSRSARRFFIPKA